MPAKRLPWIKFWIKSLGEDKIANLSDAQFRTWMYVTARASEQRPVRWRFSSPTAAANAAGRPLPQVRALVKARLLDEKEDGVWVHDWKDWQQVYPSDFSSHHSEKGERSTAPNTPPSSLKKDDQTLDEKIALFNRPSTQTEQSFRLTHNGADVRVPKTDREASYVAFEARYRQGNSGHFGDKREAGKAWSEFVARHEAENRCMASLEAWFASPEYRDQRTRGIFTGAATFLAKWTDYEPRTARPKGPDVITLPNGQKVIDGVLQPMPEPVGTGA